MSDRLGFPSMRLGKLIVNALALVVASLVVPGFHLNLKLDNNLIYLAALALIFGLINTFIRPIAKLISLPINLLTLGLFGFVINGLMLVLLAWVMGRLQSDPYVLRLGTFPPDFNLNTLTAAILGAIVISIVSTVLDWFLPDK
jgi:putative membrane protein